MITSYNHAGERTNSVPVFRNAWFSMLTISRVKSPSRFLHYQTSGMIHLPTTDLYYLRADRILLTVRWTRPEDSTPCPIVTKYLWTPK